MNLQRSAKAGHIRKHDPQRWSVKSDSEKPCTTPSRKTAELLLTRPKVSAKEIRSKNEVEAEWICKDTRRLNESTTPRPPYLTTSSGETAELM